MTISMSRPAPMQTEQTDVSHEPASPAAIKSPAPEPLAAMRALERDRRFSREWLLTNGLGGFAMGTALGTNVRRYHALMVAALDPPVRRINALHTVIDEYIRGETVFPLATHRLGARPAFHPEGWRTLEHVDVEPHDHVVHWRFRAGGCRIERSLEVVPGENTVFLHYVVHGGRSPGRLRIRPFTPLISFHELLREGQQGAPAIHQNGRETLVERDGMQLRLEAFIDREGSEPWFEPEPQWWYAFALEAEQERGQDWLADSFSPGMYELPVIPGDRVHLAIRATMEANPKSDESRESLPPPVPGTVIRAQHEPVDRRMEKACDQFVVRRGGDGASIVAGYPWFGDWGRDTMISLPGLLLSNGRLDEALRVFHTFADHERDGLIPNCFHDSLDHALFNTVDASLWFVHALRCYLASPGAQTDESLINVCTQIMESYRDGTDFGIRMDPDDGLVMCGESGADPVTWMDAKRDGTAFTPRVGKPVEINALWINALRAIEEIGLTDDVRAEAGRLAERAEASFTAAFWWDERNCLCDGLIRDRATGGWTQDQSMRPNQIFACSLPFSPLEPDQRRAVVAAVRTDLLTPYGLRTLAPDDPAYIGRYEGSLLERDKAYHNGTVWPWLLGAYCDAILRDGRDDDLSRTEVRTVIAPLLGELDRGCTGSIAEVYDGDTPHRASGCPAQAWSVAELNRIMKLVASEG